MVPTPIRLSATRSALAATAACLAAASLAGCFAEGGLGFSDDNFTFVSRPFQPWSITLKDTRTNEDFWTVEVPVGQQLVIQFREGQGTPDSFTPDLMEWGLMEPGTQSARLGNSMPVPPSNSRRLDPVLRSVPEIPPRMVNATTPSGGPAGASADNP